MDIDVVIAGFGGQGVLLIGKMLAYTGMHEGREVSFFPAYGAEMRGGTCNCTVVVSAKPVGSPVVERPRALIALNLPSLDKFEPKLKPGGLLLVNSSLIAREPKRTDVQVLKVPANAIANELGNPRGLNMVALGAFVGATQAVSRKALEQVIRDTFEEKPKLIAPNLEALSRGWALGEALNAPAPAARAAEAHP